MGKGEAGWPSGQSTVWFCCSAVLPHLKPISVGQSLFRQVGGLQALSWDGALLQTQFPAGSEL